MEELQQTYTTNQLTHLTTSLSILDIQDTKVNIPFNMERRIRTIVSDEERLKQKLEDLKAILESKNYPKKKP